MMKIQGAHWNDIRFRRVVVCSCVVVLAVLVIAGQGCKSSNFVRPQIQHPSLTKLELDSLKKVAPGAISDSDPDMCLAAGASDPQETPIGALSSRAVYRFGSQPHLQNLYARLVMETKICTGSTLSSRDRGRLRAILNSLAITDARSFAATISQTGDGLGGVKYPPVVPFSYAYDEANSTYSVQTIGKGVIP